MRFPASGSVHYSTPNTDAEALLATCGPKFISRLCPDRSSFELADRISVLLGMALKWDTLASGGRLGGPCHYIGVYGSIFAIFGLLPSNHFISWPP